MGGDSRMEGKNYERDLEIDKYALDAECMDQPRRFIHWAELLAEATAMKDRSDQALEVTKAQVEQEVRINPEAFGIDKVTEAAIKSHTTTHPKVIKAYEEWVQAKYQVNILFAAKEALEQRKSMLENLVKLFLSGYWSDPKIKGEAKEVLSKEADNEQKRGLDKSRLAKRVK